MSARMSRVRLLSACLLLGAMCLMLAGCSDDGDQTTTSVSGSTEPSTVTSVSTTGTTIDMMTEWDKKLKETANAQHLLALHLDDIGAPDDDPQQAILYGLKARVNALSCRGALDKSAVETDAAKKKELLDVADSAMREVYSTLNRGRAIATGSVAEDLADAHAIVETLGKPSERPEEAAPILEDFVDALAPMVDQAIGIATGGATMGTSADPPTTST